jgi:hypothetical protein
LLLGTLREQVIPVASDRRCIFGSVQDKHPKKEKKRKKREEKKEKKRATPKVDAFLSNLSHICVWKHFYIF